MIKLYLASVLTLLCMCVTAQVTSVSSGPWTSGSTWSTGTTPTSISQVTIASGHTVTVDGAAQAGTITVSSGATLTAASNALSITGAAGDGVTNSGTIAVSAGTITLGTAGGSNRRFLNHGVLTVSAGTLNINGNLSNTATATFTHSGGSINVDGNAAGVAGNSVATGTHIVEFLNPGTQVTLSGGTFTIVDPHVSSVNTTFTLYVMNATAAKIISSTNHTFRFGDGTSTDAGGRGFHLDPAASNTSLYFGNLVMEGPAGTERQLEAIRTVRIRGNLTINSGAEYRPQSDTYIRGNITVNAGGIGTFRSGVFFEDDGNPVAQGQTVGGAGLFRNNDIIPNAHFSAIFCNNNSAAGISFSNNVTISHVLGLQNQSVINMNGNTLTLGTSGGPSTTGTLSEANGVVKGKFRRWINTGNSSYSFPMGDKSPPRTARLQFTTGPTSVGTITAEWISANPGTNGLPLQDGAMTINNVYPYGYWRLTPGDGLAGGVYTGLFTIIGIEGSPDRTKLALLKRANATSPWTLDGTHVSAGGSNVSPEVTRTGMSGFSEFAVGSQDVVMPVRFVSFNGVQKGKTVELNWHVADQSGVKDYVVERSVDGSSFNDVGTVVANSLREHMYNFTDVAPSATARIYYRIRINDQSRVSHSSVLPLLFNSGKEMLVYPVPARDRITLNQSTLVKGTAVITNMNGKVMQRVMLTDQNQEISIGNLAPGMYVLQVGGKRVTFMKQ